MSEPSGKHAEAAIEHLERAVHHAENAAAETAVIPGREPLAVLVDGAAAQLRSVRSLIERCGHDDPRDRGEDAAS